MSLTRLKVFHAKKGTASTGTILVLTPYEGEAVIVHQLALSDVVDAAGLYTVDDQTEFLPDRRTGAAWADWFEGHRVVPDTNRLPAEEAAVDPDGQDLPQRRNELIKVAKDLNVEKPGLLDSDQLRARIIAARKSARLAAEEAAKAQEETAEETVAEVAEVEEETAIGAVEDFGALGSGEGELVGDLGSEVAALNEIVAHDEASGYVDHPLGPNPENEIVGGLTAPAPEPEPEPEKTKRKPKAGKPAAPVSTQPTQPEAPATAGVRKRVGAGCKQPDKVDGWEAGKVLQVARPHREHNIGTVEYTVRCEEDGGYRLLSARLIGKGRGRTDLRDGQYWPYASPMFHDLMMTKGKRHHKMTLTRFFKL